MKKPLGNILATVLMVHAIAIVYTWATIGLLPIMAWVGTPGGLVATVLMGTVWIWYPWTQRGDS